MNETLKTLETRRSCRNFKSDMVEQEKIDAILRAGTYAATGMGKQAPIIIAVTNKGLRDKISEENRKISGWDEGFDPFYGAPVILIVLADFGKKILADLGIEGDYEGIGHCALGYAAAELNAPAPRKENYVYYVK